MPILIEIFEKNLIGHRLLGKAFFNNNQKSIANQVCFINFQYNIFHI